MLRYLLISLILLTSSAEAAVTKDIAYGRHALQKLDVYTPTNCRVGGCPVVMWVHGGGWANGDKAGMGSEDGTAIGNVWSEKGAVVVSINYRLTPEVVHPAHVQDVAAAINWVKKNIRSYKGNPNKLYLMGHSAGGHLVALVATDPQYLAKHGLTPAGSLAGVFPIDSGGLDLEASLNEPIAGKRIAAAFGTSKQALRAASPIYNVKQGRSYPPFTLAAVKQRPVYAVSQMRRLEQALRSVGGEATGMVVDYPGASALKAHGYIAEDLANPNSEMTKTLMRTAGIIW